MKYLAVLMLLFPVWLASQTCEGNLGDNIFEEGDFGSGSSNVLLSNPGIAPGYAYITNPPPGDGFYTITNNTGVWSGLYPTWLAIGDNSSDPNGYMMVVNASFDTGLFYDQEIDNLCENTQYEFSADIINLVAVGVTAHIEPNVTFLIDGMAQFSTGDIPQTDQWQTYGFTFSTEPGQTSLRLSLRNNAPGGIGNDLALDNISFRTCGDAASILPEEPANICVDGQPLTLFATTTGNQYDNPAYQWQFSPNGIDNWMDLPGANDSTYIHDILIIGEYYYRFQLANGPINLMNEKCRINSNIKLVNVRPTEYFVTDTICTGSTYEVGFSSYTESGMFVDSLINTYGCDSIIYTDLTVLPDPGIAVDLGITPPSCFNVADGSIEVLNINNGSPPYDLFWNNGQLGTASLIDQLIGATSYDLLISDRFGCTADTSVLLPAPIALTLDLGPDQDLELGDELTVSASANFTINATAWSSTTDLLPCPSPDNCQQITWLPTTTQTVFLTAEDENGCVVTDSLNINVTPVYDLYIPNVFSPNRDGVNDVFTVYGESKRINRIASMEIFNRWGQLLYQETDLPVGTSSVGWAGRSANNRVVDQGVYLYRIEVEFLDGTIREFAGDITLLR
ncbi:MAG: gliding motility-associated C-terminal domain-containing protein [Bacteroidota bacterium]